MKDEISPVALDFLYQVLPKTKSKVINIKTLGSESIYDYITASGQQVKPIRFMDFLYPGMDFDFWREAFDDQILYDLMFPQPVRVRLQGRVIMVNGHCRFKGLAPYLAEAEAIPDFLTDYHTETRLEFFDGDVVFYFIDAGAISYFYRGGLFAHNYFPDLFEWAKRWSP